jgi:hypothetical protein
MSLILKKHWTCGITRLVISQVLRFYRLKASQNRVL